MSALRFWVQLPQAGGVASQRNIRAFAALAEQLGYDGVWLGDHIAMPDDYASQYPYGAAHPVPTDRPFLEAFTTLAFVAGATTRVRLAVAVAVAPYRQPVLQAKTIATLDALSGGRLEVGFGSGWLEEEFAALGVSFADRQSLSDETLDVMRKLWTGQPVWHEGRHFTLAGIRCLPIPEQRPAPPIWIGGLSPRALRRVGESGANWVAPDVDLDRLVDLVGKLRETPGAEHARVSSRVGVVLDGGPAPGARLVVAPEAPADLLVRLAGLGVTDVRLELTTLPPRERLGAVAKLARGLEEAGLKAA